MKVIELIEILRRMDPQKEVIIINPNDVEFYVGGVTERGGRVVVYAMSMPTN